MSDTEANLQVLSMDALGQLRAISLVVAALLLLMACIPASWWRAARAGVNPSGPELSGTALAGGRAILVAVAVGIFLWTAVETSATADDAWDDGELTSAVEGATEELDGYLFRLDNQSQDTPFFEDYGTLVEDKIIRNGGSGTPEDGVSADPAPANTDEQASFTVEADGADVAFCIHLTRVRSKTDDYTPPGIGGGSGVYKEIGYRLKAGFQDSGC